MPLVSLRDVLRDAAKEHYAVGAFDTMDHAFAEGILQAAEETGAPVILMSGDFIGPDYENFMPYLLDRISRTKVPVCLHFDHGVSFQRCANAIRVGYSGVMIDGSALPFEENVAVTRSVVEMAHACGVDVEGEIGHVGANAGSVEGSPDNSVYTQPEFAVEFAERTGIDALAVSIGTSHGVYKNAPSMDYELLEEIRSSVPVPLVMHGGSGLSDEDYKKAIHCGISKINAFTNLTLKVTERIREDMKTIPAGTMSHELSLRMTLYAKEEVLRHIRLFETKPVKYSERG